MVDPLFGSNTEVDMGKHTIIPNNERSFSGSWNKKYPFNYYKVTFSATDGNGNPVVVTATMWAVPLMIVIPALLGLILLIIIIRLIRKKYKIVSK